MSDETGTSIDTTATPSADAGATTGTAPAVEPTAQPAAAAPARTFTQADVDRIAENERKRAERAYQRQLETLQRQQERPAETRDPASDAVRAQIEALVGPIVAPIRQQQVEINLDRAVVALGKRIPEFTDEKKVTEILQTVVDMGLDRATHLSLDQALELGYRYWKHDELAKLATQQPDIEAIKKQAVDEAIKAYTTKKVETASKTPRPEGAGGTGAVTGKPKTLRRDEFNAAIEAALARAE